jgi:hypothetical protein
MQTNPIALRRAAVLTAGAAAGYLIVRHLIAAYSGLDRPIGSDESEYLHAGWLMHQGLRLYRDFAENHAPFLFVILKWMVPTGGTAAFPLLDLGTYVARARIFASIVGVLGLGALAALSYRAIRSLIAPLVAIAVLLASPWVWSRALVEARNDPPALFFFWTGALLLLGGWRSERLRFALAGIGIGLVAISAIWNPKWPLESLVLGVFYLAIAWRASRRGMRMLALMILPPAVCVIGALGAVMTAASLGDYFFFAFRCNKLLTDWIAASPHLTEVTAAAFPHGLAYIFCSPAFKGIWPVLAVILAVALLSIPAMRDRLHGMDVNILRVLLALAAAATLEIRFVYPYPNVWTQYYLMWSFIAAALYGIGAAALLRLLPGDGMRFWATLAIAAMASVAVEQAMPLRPGARGWPMLSYLQRNLRPGETVWVVQHPIGARDAGYYWYNTTELVPFSIEYTARHPGETPLPAITEKDLPVCRAERGLQADLRYVSGGYFLEAMPEANACLRRMIAAKRAVKTPVTDVWDLHP